jgi:hypothetical protein
MDAQQIEMHYAQLTAQAAQYRHDDPQLAHWATGYGVIQHTALTQVRIHEIARRLSAQGVQGDGVAFYNLLAALDRVASAAMPRCRPIRTCVHASAIRTRCAPTGCSRRWNS